MSTQVTEADLAWLASLPPEREDGESVSPTAGHGDDDVSGALAAFDNAFAAERAAGGSGGASAPAVVAPMSSSDDDAAWLRANPTRKLRVRARRPDDRKPYWAAWSSQLFAVVRRSLYGRPDVTLVPVEAVGGVMPDETDEAGLAALRGFRRWLSAARANV